MRGYGLGVDVGTTWTAAAIMRGGAEPQMLSLGGRSAAVPTVVYGLDDGSANVGEAAERRAVVEPHRVAREFKRRVGDTAPVLLGGQPWSPERLLVTVLRWVIGRATELEGEPPSSIVVTRPANWGPLRRELLEQAVAHVGLSASFTTEPEAAAVHYASAARVPDGTTVAVYDFGGGTFDATVLRKSGDGFAVLGKPGGIERLGGLDIDAAVVGHVTSGLGEAWSGLDPDDDATESAAARLREECVRAKEALSEDPDVVIPVQLPSVTTTVRMTRAELEHMIRPSIEESVVALERAIAAARLSPADIDRVLLVGGSSRIPLVSEILAARLGRPVALDTHPKHAVALGAARLAAASIPEDSVPLAVAAAPPVADAAPMPPPATDRQPAPRSRPRWLPLAAGTVALVVIGVVAALALGGGDGDGGDGGGVAFERSGSDGDELVEVSDDSGLITVAVPERWASVGGQPIDFDDSEVSAPDVVASTDEEAFQTELAVAGVRITVIDAAGIEEFGLLGDVVGLVSDDVDGPDLPGVCESEDESSELEIADFAGTMRTFNGCDGAAAVQIFGGFDDGGRGLIVQTHLVDEDDEAVIDDVLDSIAVG